MVPTFYTLFVMFGLQLIAKVQVRNYTKKNNFSDQRLKLMSNIIESISVVKMYAWDIPYRYLVEKLWASQIKWVRIISLYKQIHITIFLAGQGIAFLLTFVTYVYTGNTMKLSDITSAIGLILSMQYIVIGLAGLGIQQVSKIFSAANRIQTVLLAPEYEKEDVPASKFAIEMKDLSASWEVQDKVNVTTHFV